MVVYYITYVLIRDGILERVRIIQQRKKTKESKTD